MDENETESKEVGKPNLNLKEMHATALKEYSLAVEYWDPIYTRSLQDIEFADGDQWPSAQVRSRRKRPTITENKVPQFVDKICSPVREEGLKIKIMPPDTDNITDEEQQKILKQRIDIYQGKISDIEQQSSAIDAYVKGIQFASTGGIGFIRITLLPNEYTNIPEIKIVRSAYPFSIYLDPSIEEVTGSDNKYGFAIEKKSRDDYEDEYGKDAIEDLPSYPSTSLESWINKDEITVAEYFKILTTKETILIMADGTEVLADDSITEEELALSSIVATREQTKKQLFHAKMNGVKFLEHTVLDIPYIPIVLVSGREIIQNHKRSLVGLVHYLRDAQTKYNFYASAEVEIVALSPKATFMAAAQQIEPYRQIWNKITTVNMDVLPYDASPINGVSIPPPQRLSMLNSDFVALISAKAAAFEDMKSNTGIYNVGVSEQKIEESGKAILLRETAQNQNNNIYYFNLTESIKQVAKIVIEMLPMTFDPTVPIQMRSEDGKKQKISVEENPFTLTCDDMIIETGKNYDTRRTETADQMMSLITLLAPIVPDPTKMMEIAALLTKSLNIVDGQRVYDILTGATPNGQPAQDPAMMQDMQEALKVIQKLQQMIDDMSKKLKDKQADRELEMDKAILDTKTKLAIAELDIQGKIELSQGKILERAVSQGHGVIPELVPNQNDIDTNVAESVNHTTNGIIVPLNDQSNVAFNDQPVVPAQPPEQPEQPINPNL